MLHNTIERFLHKAYLPIFDCRSNAHCGWAGSCFWLFRGLPTAIIMYFVPGSMAPPQIEHLSAPISLAS